ncbi:MAG: helix-turn-helix domain-containing protein [Ruminococcus sp.]
MQYERIRNLREDADLYQRDLAEYLHCTQVTYSRYELGTRDIPTDVLIALAEFYQTSTDYLLGLTDEKKPYPKSKTLE